MKRQAAASDGGTARITLITGDRVRVTTRPGKPEAVNFEPGPASRSDSALISYAGGHTFVIPSAAAADVVSGRLDRTLFDLTTLLAEGRDDARSATMPVIIRYAGGGAAALGRARQAKVPGVAGTRLLTSLGARAAGVRKTSAKAFWSSVTSGPSARVASTVQRVSLDRRVKASLDQSVPQIGAPAAWQRGLTGRGIKVAVLDTGLDPTHPDLSGRIAASANFSGAADAVDHLGHGTHVASTLAGDGSASGGRYKGVAPEATLLNGKVLGDDGTGSSSEVIAGMEWAAAQGAAVVNLSLGSQPTDGADELSLAVNRLSADTGTLFVIAAGNCYDQQPGSVSSPASADAAVAVGNLLRDGSLNGSSCRGPRKGDGALKPEISAPGTGIVAARAAGTELGEPVGDSYVTLSGTSMATPHVAGTAALIAQQHPAWTFEQLRARLISTADPQSGSRVDEQGAGRVDADQATGTSAAESVTVDTGELELGVLRWPYPGTDPVSRELTYRNPSGTAVTLQLAVSVESAPAPKLSASQLVVPAGGEAKVTVTADRAAAGPGQFSGRITATAAGADPLVTTVGWYAEPELYNLTVKGLAREGGPADGGLSVSRLDGDPVDLGMAGVSLRNGSATLRLPPGKYEVSSIFFAEATDQRRERMDLVTSAETSLRADATAVLDARRAKPVRLAVSGQGGLTARDAAMQYLRMNTAGVLTGGVGVSVSGAPRDFGATPTKKTVTGTSEFSSGTRLEVPAYRAKTLGASGAAFSVLDFHLGPRFTGTKDLQLFDAGTGTPAELAGAHGKLALIRYLPAGPSNGQLVKAAEDAGAAAALLYAPDWPGLNAVQPFWMFDEGEEASIPATRTSRVSAQRLLDQLKTGPVTVRLVGQAATPVVYDLVVPWPNRIPADARLTAGSNQFARLDETFGSHTAGMRTSETRYGWTPASGQFGGWLLPVFTTPARRTSYLLANNTKWSSALVLDNGGENMSMLSSERSYRAGDRSSVRWLNPVANSGLPISGVIPASIDSGALAVWLSPFMHGPDQFDTSYGGGGEFGLTVHRNGEEIASAPDSGVWVEVPPGAADYRLSLDARRENPFWRYSTKVRSTWEFRSQGQPTEVLPLVLADLDVPQADALNQVTVGRPTRITLALRHQTGSSTARFTTAELELSYDGQKWTKLPLRSVGAGKYVTTVTHPVAEAGKAPSLRVVATDADGNKLVQEVTRAYGLVTG